MYMQLPPIDPHALLICQERRSSSPAPSRQSSRMESSTSTAQQPQPQQQPQGGGEEPGKTKTVLRLAAISGSLRRASTNTGLIRAAAEICRESIPGLQVNHVDISDLPLLNTDFEVDGGFPPAVEAFRDKVRGADCFLFASPEYNYSISGPLKNALDWGSRPPNCWADRAAAILSASGGSGGNRSQYHIRQVGVFLDIHFINKPEVFTKAHLAPKKFDADGNLVDLETREQLRKMLLSLQTFALRLRLGKPAADIELGN